MTTPYSKFFLQVERVTGKPITIVNPKKFEEFMDMVASDENLDEATRIYVLLAMSSGLRVSEVLALKASDFEVKRDGNYSITAPVLKKRAKITRKVGVYPAGKIHVDKMLAGKRYNEYILYERANRATRTLGRKLTRNDMAYRLRTAFQEEGFTCHSLRHSLISYLTMHKKRPASYVSALIKITPNMLYRYSNCDGSDASDDEFKKEA